MNNSYFLINVKNYKNYFLLTFFLITPFLNLMKVIFPNSIVYSILVTFLAIILICFFEYKKCINFNFLVLLIYLFILTIILHFMYQIIEYNFFSHWYVILYSLGILLVIFSMNFISIKDFFIKYYLSLLMYTYIIMGIFILYDYVLIEFKLEFLQLFYRSDAIDLKYRPLGLSGYPSMNSISIIFIYFLILHQYDIKGELFCITIFIFSILTVILVFIQQSGAGFLVLILSFIILFFRVNKKKLLMVFIIVAVIMVLVRDYVDFYKMSPKSILEVLLIFFKEFQNYWDNVKSMMDLLFGINGHIKYQGGELIYVNIISRLGLLFSLIYFFILIKIILMYRNIFFTIAIISLFVGSAHFGAAFSFWGNHFLITLIILNILDIEYTNLKLRNRVDI
mgnify:CR=1 FL=1